MKIYACDDENLALLLLKDAVITVNPQAELICFSDAEDLINEAKQSPCDVAFLDVHIPKMSGIDLAKKLIEINPKVNIIFVTGYDDYYCDAMDMFASGYILKPVTEEKIKRQFVNLRYPISKTSRLYAKTFGNFVLFCDDKAVHFSRSDSKQMLAYLIDRQGADVSRREMANILFEDGEYSRPIQTRLSMVFHDLMEDLKKIDAQDIVIYENNSFSLDKSKICCDLFDFLDAEETSLFTGEYMEQYSWSEEFKATHRPYMN